MNLTDMTITSFSELLASDAPAPGGGSAAALCGVIGVALTNMVASLTVGKKKYAEHQQLMESTIEQATRIRLGFVDAIDKDTEAFNGVSAVFSMPRDTDEQKTARKVAMQKALKGSTLPPFEMMQLSLEALQLTEKALGKSNTNAISDLGVAALSLKAAIQGAWLNILINVSGIEDEDFASKYRNEGQSILDQALPLADEIYEAVVKQVG